RPLKSQKSSISNCSLEFKTYLDENGKEIRQLLKTIPKSNPIYQEFRILQWMQNLSIYTKEDDINVTGEFLNNVEVKEKLFEFLLNRKDVDQKQLIKFLIENKGFKG